MRLSNPEKLNYATLLLQDKVPIAKIREKLNEKYGSAMSNSDLVKLRNEVKIKKIPNLKDLENFRQAFLNTYNFLFEILYEMEKGELNYKSFKKLLYERLDISELDLLYKKGKKQ